MKILQSSTFPCLVPQDSTGAFHWQGISTGASWAAHSVRVSGDRPTSYRVAGFQEAESQPQASEGLRPRGHSITSSPQACLSSRTWQNQVYFLMEEWQGHRAEEHSGGEVLGGQLQKAQSATARWWVRTGQGPASPPVATNRASDSRNLGEWQIPNLLSP